MIIDGKQLAESLKTKLAEASRDLGGLTLAVILVGDNPTSRKFIERKEQFGKEIGVAVDRYEYEAGVSFAELEREISRLNNDEKTSGIVVQLPLPTGELDPQLVLGLIAAAKDVDALSGEARVPSPVVRAIDHIFKTHKVELSGKKILVVGQGRLVGKPVAVWLASEGYDVETADITTDELEGMTKRADVIITGCGSPHLIKPEMIKPHAVLIDAGTSVIEGKIKGDIDPACAELSDIFTPVPGGIGPLTVAMLFANLIDLSGQSSGSSLF